MLVPMPQGSAWPPPDPLGEALHFLRLEGTFYCRSELREPWGMTLPPMAGCLWFHAVTAGRAWLEVGDAAPRAVRPGDFTLVPHGRGHVLRSAPGVAAPPVLDLDREPFGEHYEVLRHGGGGAPATLVCGAVRVDHPAGRELIARLPPVVEVPAGGSPQGEWMESTLRLMAAEAGALRPGGETVITRLADVLVVQAIRSWLETDPAARAGWLGALRDGQIGRALTLIHRDPARDWTVAALARELAMSRSAFAARFSELVDEPAMRYVARWRMHLALDRLGEEGVTVSELAGRLGYRSEAAFSRAFKRIVGVSPGAARRRPGGAAG
jgi:AraC-like DNA-binding protein